MLVDPRFVDRLQKGQAAALRELAKADLTTLYRRGYTKLTREQMQPGLFWSKELPPLVRVPLVRSRHAPSAALPDYTALTDSSADRKTLQLARSFWKNSQGAGLTVNITQRGKKVTAVKLKPNPRFELVVVNKYDRAALLKLLGEVDTASNVEKWLAARTNRSGVTQSTLLHEDYETWCEQRGETATGSKSFAQALVAAGVVKLKRGAVGERYELELRAVRK